MDEVRKNTGIFLARLQGMRKRAKPMRFTGVYSAARSALFIVPNIEEHKAYVAGILQRAQEQFVGNNLTVVIAGQSGTLSAKLKQCMIVPVHSEEINFFFLPKHTLILRLQEQQYDVIVDLNLRVTPLAASICARIDAPLKAGFSSSRSDALYNFQLQTTPARDPKLQYEQLLHTLAMF